MPSLRLITGGESHGKMLTAMLEGFPAGLKFDQERVNEELAARQMGFGRSGRQRIEHDTVIVSGGVRHGITTGAPLVLHIENRDFENWHHVMATDSPSGEYSEADEGQQQVLAQLKAKKIERFRPGHADYAGTIKYAHGDIRDVLERASARETAARVAAGAAALLLLEACDIEVAGHVIAIGPVKAHSSEQTDANSLSLARLQKQARNSEAFCLDNQATEAMKEAIKEALVDGDSLGGVIEILADGLPVGLGSYSQWDRRLDGQLAQALMSIQAFKAMEVGDGIVAAAMPGSLVHDALYQAEKDAHLPAQRKTNHAGGLEGGMTNGERLILRAYMKPIPTLKAGLDSLSFPEFEPSRAHFERSDVCAVPAASVVAKAMVCLTLANSLLDKFAADSMLELSYSLKNYRNHCRQLSS
jgi:chorismate synthase